MLDSSKSHFKLEHVISFGDAIFAFSITIVLLSIQVPQIPNPTESDIVKAIWNLRTPFESYAISFAVIGIYWVLYHKVFNRIIDTHPLITGFNLVFLFFITLISLFTILNINYGSFHIVFILYTIILASTGFVLTIIWVIAIKTKSIHGEMNPSLVKLFLWNSITPPVIFTVSIAVSYISIDVAQYFWVLIVPCRLIISKRYKTKSHSLV